MNKTTAEYWAPRITAEWRKSVEGILGVGRQLIAAKKACGHGEFLRLFKGHENAVIEPVPFSANTAEILMKVANHPVLSKSEIAQTLPQSWYTLYELTKLDDSQTVEGMKRGDIPLEMSAVSAGIKAGEITPDMTRAEATALRADPVEHAEMPVHEQLSEAIEKVISRHVGRLRTKDEFASVRDCLRELIKFLTDEEAERGIGRTGQKAASARAG